MKHFGNAFSELLFRTGITQKAVGEKLHTSHVTVTRWKNEPSIDASTLEQICRIFHVPIEYFFDADVIDNANSIKNNPLEIELLRAENAMLHQLLDEKERTIQLLMASPHNK